MGKILKITSLFSIFFLLASFKQPYVLQDSETYGPWKEEYLQYNCYAFAINRTEIPPEFSTNWQYQPGDFSNQQISSMSVESIANIVKDDLLSLTYKDISISTSSNNLDYDHTIVLRSGISDFHFMKLSSNNNWYHKPGNSHVLKYKYFPNNNRIWTNERVNKNGNALSPTTTYDSQIYFISYNEPHEHDFSYRYEWNNLRAHYAYCECGFKQKIGHFVSGLPNNQGLYTCLLCGGSAEMGFTVADMSARTANGNYVVENGVLYLTNAEFLEYLRGNYVIPNDYFVYWRVL
jgi:hypothetical protein